MAIRPVLVAILVLVAAVTSYDRIHGHNASPVLRGLDWAGRFNGTHVRLPRFLGSHLRKRQTVPVGTNQSDQAFQRCVTPSGGAGRCRHLQFCILEDFRTSFPRFLDYFCVVERSFVGVCCPDREGAAIPSQGDLFGLFPFLANGTDSVSSSDAGTQGRGCGVSTNNAKRVEGGRPAEPKEWPWMVALLRDGSRQYCGGVLITNRHVLTAAHCVEPFQPREVTARLGEYNLETPAETRFRNFRITEFRIHEEYERTTYENDIAILKLGRTTTFNSYIWPVCLPPGGENFANETAIVTGWGTLFYGGPSSSILMEVAVPVWEQTRCVPQFSQPILDTFLCAGGYDGGKDSCQGDSGGPLLYQGTNGRWMTIGVVSWGVLCGEPGSPGVYTRVNMYLDWITKNSAF